jgi:TusA-related sulfurtransferase
MIKDNTKADVELYGISAEEIKKMESSDRLIINGNDFISKKYAVDLCTRFAKQQLYEQRVKLIKYVIAVVVAILALAFFQKIM